MHNRTMLGIASAGVAAGAMMGMLAVPAHARDMTQTRLENADAEPDNWLHVNGNYSEHRFTNLAQINRENVKDLKLRMMILLGGQTPAVGGRYQVTRLEGTPTAEDGFLYVTDGWGALYKVDIRSGNRADFVWKMDPQVDKVWAGDVACCGVDNRGVGLWKDAVISAVLDGRLVATNKETGEVKWEAKLADPAFAETITVAPLIVRDIAILGISGAEYGIRGRMIGTDLTTGKIKWTTNTAGGNDRDPTEKAKTTWLGNTNSWETGGGSVWQTGSYDPKLNLMYWGTGNAGPDYDQEYRPGDNLYTASILAMNPDDGFIKWYFQFVPGDPYDYDEIAENPLIDIDIGGKATKLVVHAARNGYYYGFDRANGQFQYGKPYPVVVDWAGGLDPKTGYPMLYKPGAPLQTYRANSVANRTGNVAFNCPSSAKRWEPTAYNPNLKLMYVNSGEDCRGPRIVNQVVAFEDKPTAPGTAKRRTNFTGGATPTPAALTAAGGDPRPITMARYSLNIIDPVSGDLKTKVFTTSWNWGFGATAGNLVFGGTNLGDLTAYDGANFNALWTFNVGTAIGAPPMSFGYQGKQYVAVLAGNAAGALEQAARPSTKFFTASNYLFVFGL